MDIENKSVSVTLVADTDNNTFSLIGIKKVGFLYRAANSSVSQKIEEHEKMSILKVFNDELGRVTCLYRNDKLIEKIEVLLWDDDGTTLILDDWTSDFTVFTSDTARPTTGTYKAYDVSNRLIAEVTY